MKHIPAALAAVLLATAGAAAEPSKLRIGYSGASEFLPAFVAQDEGLFRKHGLDTILTNIPLSSTIPSALMSETLDIGITSPTAILIADEGGLDLVGICASNRLAADNPRIALVARPGISIAQPSDLVGHKIGIPGFYSSIEVMFRKWALDRGVKPASLTLVEVALPQMADVLRSGSVDAVTAIEPVISRIKANVPGVTSIDYVSQLSPDVLGAMWMATRPWLVAHRDAAHSFVAAYEDAIAFIKQNPDEAHKIEQKYVGFVGRSFPSFSVALTAADIDFYQSMMLDLGLLKTHQDAASLLMP